MAWYILQIFCFGAFFFRSSSLAAPIHCFTAIVRIACGVVVILFENNRLDIGRNVAAIVLSNAGFFPLIAATIGLILKVRVQLKNDGPISLMSNRSQRSVLFPRH